jgi:predicted branched-subunit amino acid permease
MLPVLAGAVPFALLAGAIPVQESISAAAAMGMSVIIFAGAAQLAAAQQIGGGAAPWIVVFTVAAMNLRFVMYSASLAPHLGETPAHWKTLLSYLLTDQAYAVAITRFYKQDTEAGQGSGEPGDEGTAAVKGKVGYYLGAALALWVVWQLGTASGIALGARVPEALALDFTIPLVFLALLFSAATDRASAAAALGAGAVALFGAELPLNLGLILAILAGVVIGMSGPALARVRGSRNR